MKKKIAILLSVLLAVGTLVACGGSAATPTEVTHNFLTALQNQDFEGANRYSVGEDEEDFDFWDSVFDDMDDDPVGIYMVERLMETFFEFDFELSNEEIDGDTATIDVQITAYNWGDVLEQWFESFFEEAFDLAMAGASEDEIEQLGLDLLSEALGNMSKDYVDTVELTLVRVGGNWLVDEIEEDGPFVNALFGGVLDLVL